MATADRLTVSAAPEVISIHGYKKAAIAGGLCCCCCLWFSRSAFRRTRSLFHPDGLFFLHWRGGLDLIQGDEAGLLLLAQYLLAIELGHPCVLCVELHLGVACANLLLARVLGDAALLEAYRWPPRSRAPGSAPGRTCPASPGRPSCRRRRSRAVRAPRTTWSGSRSCASSR